jgi:hypoxanthine phosphoribosyltransferase
MGFDSEAIQVKGKAFERMLSKEEIDLAVQKLADRLNEKYAVTASPPLFLGILNGSFIFMADLIRKIQFECTVQFIRIESYQGMESTGMVKMEADVAPKWAQRHVIVVEDIIDTGRTMNRFLPVLQSHQPLSVFLAALLFKEEALEFQVPLDHYCFKIAKKFVVGYGLDYDGFGRQLDSIYQAIEE